MRYHFKPFGMTITKISNKTSAAETVEKRNFENSWMEI